MKKYLILLIIPLLFFSTGCEEDEDLDVTESLSLDTELFGVWCCSIENTYPWDCFSFLSNGTSFSFDYNQSNGNIIPEVNDDESYFWMVESGFLFLSEMNSENQSVYLYNVNGEQLTLQNNSEENLMLYYKE